MSHRVRWEQKLLEFNLLPQNLDGNFSILQTSTERDVISTMCCSIKAVLEAVAKSEKEIGEVSDKVRVTDGPSAQKAWHRMLLTIDGLNEPELQAVTQILPNLGLGVAEEFSIFLVSNFSAQDRLRQP